MYTPSSYFDLGIHLYSRLAAAAWSLPAFTYVTRHKCTIDVHVFNKISIVHITCKGAFYRATLCIARTMMSQDVCPSVRLSVTRRYCENSAKHIIGLFHHRVATSFYFFSYHRLWQYSNGDLSPPLTGASNAGGMKNRNFRPISRFI